MRFTIEKRCLTDDHGKPLPTAADVEFFAFDVSGEQAVSLKRDEGMRPDLFSRRRRLRRA